MLVVVVLLRYTYLSIIHYILLITAGGGGLSQLRQLQMRLSAATTTRYR